MLRRPPPLPIALSTFFVLGFSRELFSGCSDLLTGANTCKRTQECIPKQMIVIPTTACFTYPSFFGVLMT